MSDSLSDSDRARIEQALSSGRKIEAIKLYREATGAGLVEAKKAVEAMEVGLPFAGASTDELSAEDVNNIQAALFAGKKILAIKIYRAATGKQLKVSKDFIDSLEAELRRTELTRFTVPAAKGCGTALVACGLLLLSSAAVAWFVVLRPPF